MEKKDFRIIPILGIGIYLVSLLAVSLLFGDHRLETKFMLWGVGEVLFFFVLTWLFFSRWKDDSHKLFWRKVFFVALGLRVLYAVFISYYYFYQTGVAMEYGAGDSVWYHKTASYLSRVFRAGHFLYPFQYLRAFTMGFSDSGYILWLSFVYTIFGPNLLVPRLLKALMSAYMCIAIYKFTSRTFDEKTGRLAAVMCVFMPIFIQMTGLHTKECEMLFLSVMALERMDYLIRSQKFTIWNIAFPILLTALTFGFRTIIGMCLIFAFLVFVVVSSPDLIDKRIKIITSAVIVVVFSAFLFSPIGREMEVIEKRNFYQIDFQSEKYASEGLQHSELAKNVYMLPGAFVLPLSPMVDQAPAHNKMIHGSTYLKNFLAFFAMLALVIVMRERKWRNFSLIGVYELSYLGIIMLSFAFNSERYHEPALPMMIVMAAFAVIHSEKKDSKWLYLYCGLLFVALLTWNWLKLSARGLV